MTDTRRIPARSGCARCVGTLRRQPLLTERRRSPRSGTGSPTEAACGRSYAPQRSRHRAASELPPTARPTDASAVTIEPGVRSGSAVSANRTGPYRCFGNLAPSRERKPSRRSQLGTTTAGRSPSPGRIVGAVFPQGFCGRPGGAIGAKQAAIGGSSRCPAMASRDLTGAVRQCGWTIGMIGRDYFDRPSAASISKRSATASAPGSLCPASLSSDT